MKIQLSKILILLLLFTIFGCKEEKVIKKDKIDELLEQMSLDEKISQLLIINYEADELDENMKNELKTNPPSGFILLKNNITTFDKTKKLVSDMKNSSKYPLIISIDEEGGSVQRLSSISDIDIPFMYELGIKNDENLTYSVGKVIAEELRTIGVNVDFAPDIDVYSNPNNTVIGKRSFSSDPNVVSKHGTILAKSLEDNRVIPVYKHFPGHGDTEVDSHNDLPIVNKTLKQLEELDFIPFKEAIKSKAKMIMVGHIALPNITNDNTPSSLSKTVIDILKEDLNYDGLIITDALNMGALTKNYSNEEIYVKAIEAGCDLLLMPQDGLSSINTIKEKVKEEVIDKSVRRILKFKYKYLKEDNTLDSSYLNSPNHKIVVDKIG